MQRAKTVKTRLKIRIESYQLLTIEEFKELVRWYYFKYGHMYGEMFKRQK
jgi:hypothetical protein